ncbi:MAG TPA: hypothetical protein VFE42_36925 [Chloroflexota bacterium]|nr:hypothetical protein [Chloroflexota bacterium]
MVPEAEAIQESINELTVDISLHPAALLPLLTSDPPPGTARIEIQPGFFDVDVPNMSIDERRQSLRQLFGGAAPRWDPIPEP